MTGAALEELDLTAALAALREQELHGHTAATDADLPIAAFGSQLNRRAVELADVLRPGDRQNLTAAYRRAARLAAYALATMRRIRVEQEKERSTDR